MCSAKTSYRRKLEILCKLKLHGPLTKSEIQKHFDFNIDGYLASLKATENISLFNRFGEKTNRYKFLYLANRILIIFTKLLNYNQWNNQYNFLKPLKRILS